MKVRGPKHQCQCSRLARVRHAHLAPPGTTVTCDVCGRAWRVTKNHLGPHCGCGWEPAEVAA